ncbi:MAG: hypothetical protein V4812_15075 [Pseudomonadota bacterium]
MNPNHPHDGIEQPAQDTPDFPPIDPETPAPDRDEPSPEVNQPLVEPDAQPQRLEDPENDPTAPEVGEGDNAEDGEWPPGSPSKGTEAQGGDSPDTFPAEQDLINDDTLDRPV